MSRIVSLIIEPPASTRASKSKVDPEILAAMAQAVTDTTWGFDGQTYKTSKEANTAAGLYRRSLPKALEIEPHQLKSKVWGQDKDGNIVTDRSKAADWRFAFTIDRDRVRRTRRTVNGEHSST